MRVDPEQMTGNFGGTSPIPALSMGAAQRTGQFPGSVSWLRGLTQ